MPIFLQTPSSARLMAIISWLETKSCVCIFIWLRWRSRLEGHKDVRDKHAPCSNPMGIAVVVTSWMHLLNPLQFVLTFPNFVIWFQKLPTQGQTAWECCSCPTTSTRTHWPPHLANLSRVYVTLLWACAARVWSGWSTNSSLPAHTTSRYMVCFRDGQTSLLPDRCT